MAKEPTSSEKPAAPDAAPAAEAQLDSVLKDQVAREVQEEFAAQGEAAKPAENTPTSASKPAAAATTAATGAPATDPNAENDDAEIQRILMEEVGSLAEAAGMSTAPRDEGPNVVADFKAAEAEIAAAEAARVAATNEKQTIETADALAADSSDAKVSKTAEATPEESVAAAAAAAAEGVLSEAPVKSAEDAATDESSATSKRKSPAADSSPEAAASPETPEEAVKAVAGSAEGEAPPPGQATTASRIAEDVKAKAGGDEKVAVTPAAAGALAEAAGDRLPKDRKSDESVGGDERRALQEGEKPATESKPAAPPKKFSPRWLIATLRRLAAKGIGALGPVAGKLLATVLDLINRPFAGFLDDDSRDILGKVAILTLLAAFALFIFGLCK